MPTDPSATPNATPPGGSTGHQGDADGPVGAQAVPGADRAAEPRPGDSGLGRGWLARLAVAPVAPNAPPTPSAARESAPQHPNAATEPEDGADATAGRVALADHVTAMHLAIGQLRSMADQLDDVELWMWDALADQRANGTDDRTVAAQALEDGKLRTAIAAALEQADYRQGMQCGDLADAIMPVVRAHTARLTADKAGLQAAVRTLMRANREQQERADKVKLELAETRGLLSQWAPRLIASQPVLFRKLDALLQLSQPKEPTP